MTHVTRAASLLKKKSVITLLLLVLVSPGAFAIREFDIHTIESLGRQLYEQTQRGSKSRTELQHRAERAAIEALKGAALRGYRFVVLPDPKGRGFLVYALATSADPTDIVAGVHYRVTISADATRAERVDALSRSRAVIPKNGGGLPSGYHREGFVLGQVVSNKPVETFVYLSLLHKSLCLIVTPDASVWSIENGKIRKEKEKANEYNPSTQ
jgi:hypothetical protein